MEKRVFPPIAHIGYIVPDLDADMQAYKKFYGIEDFTVYDFRPNRAWVNGQEIEDSFFRIAMGKSASGISIELVRPYAEQTPQFKFLEATGGGINHICYLVEDFDDWRSYLLSLPYCTNVYEAEIYDDVRGYRRCIFMRQKGATTLIECAEIPRRDRKI